jgi:hypothetical protein
MPKALARSIGIPRRDSTEIRQSQKKKATTARRQLLSKAGSMPFRAQRWPVCFFFFTSNASTAMERCEQAPTIRLQPQDVKLHRQSFLLLF